MYKYDTHIDIQMYTNITVPMLPDVASVFSTAFAYLYIYAQL